MGASQQGQQSLLGAAIPILLMLAIFYFLIAFGVVLITGGAVSWLRHRKRAREAPPVPAARLLLPRPDEPD